MGRSSTLPAPDSQRGLACTAMRYLRARGQDRMSKPISANWLSQNATVTTTAFPKQHSLCQDDAEPAELLLVRANPNDPRPRELISAYKSMTCYMSEHCTKHLTIIPTLAPETGTAIFIHLDMMMKFKQLFI